MGLFSCFTGCGISKAKALVGTVAEPIEKKRFLEAAKDGNEDGTNACLEEHPDLLLCHSLANGKTAAHLAAESGHIHILEALTESLCCNASKIYGKEGSGQEPAEAIMPSLINAMDNEGRTPLSLAAEHGHVDCARFLLANGADRLIADHKGNTMLHYASWKCHLGVMFMLLGDFTEDPQTQVEAARAGQSGQSVPNSPLPSHDRLSSNESRASRPSPMPPEAGQTAAARLVNMQNIFGFAPLQYAAWSKQPAVVQVLLQYGADMLIKNPRAGTEHSILCAAGSTPLHLAAFRGHIEISRILLKTFYERFLEPMLLAQAGTGVDAATITRSVRAHDPRTQTNALNLLPHQVAHRLGFLALSMLLKPNIPILRLFSEDERAVRLYGPPQLKVLCAEALNRKLLAGLEELSKNPPPKPKLPLAVPAPAVTTVAQPPSLPNQVPQPRPSMHARHPSTGLPTVPEAEDEMTTLTNMSRDTPGFPGDCGRDSSVQSRSPPSTTTQHSVQSTAQSHSNTPAQPASPSRVGVHMQGNTFPGDTSGSSKEDLRAMFLPPNSVQQQQQEQQRHSNKHLDGTSPVHSLAKNVFDAPSLDLWQYPHASPNAEDQPRSSGTMPNPGPSPFASMAALPPSRASLETNNMGNTPTHCAATTSTVSSGGGAAPPEPAAVLSSAAAAAAAAPHVGPKAGGAPPHITAARLPGQASSSCEQHVHSPTYPTLEGGESLLLPTPPRSETSSPAPVMRSSGGGAAMQQPSIQPSNHSSGGGAASSQPPMSPAWHSQGSAAAKGSQPANAAAAASSLLHSPMPVHRDESAYASLLGGNNATANQSRGGVPGHPNLNLPNINVAHSRQDAPHLFRDSPASAGDPHASLPGGPYLHFHRQSGPGASPVQRPLPFQGPQGWSNSNSSTTIPSMPDAQRLSARSKSPSNSGARLETATSNPMPGAGFSGADAAVQLYRSASTATNGDNTAPCSSPQSGVPGNAQPSSARAGSVISGLFRTSSPNRSTSPGPLQKLRRRNSPPARSGGGSEKGAGPSTLQPAGSGSVRGGLRGLLQPQDKTNKGSMERSRAAPKKRPSLSQMRRKRSQGPSDLLASDTLSNPDDNPDNDEAHDALNVECGIHNEGITDRLSLNGGVPGPRVFMSTRGSTITLSHTPSMPIADKEVHEAAAAAAVNSGQPSTSPQLHPTTEARTTPTRSNSPPPIMPCTFAEGLGKKVMSSPALASLAMVSPPQHEEHPLMVASPLYTQLSNDGSLVYSPNTSTSLLNRLPRQDGASNNMLYSRGSTSTGLNLPGEATSKASSTSQLAVDPAAAVNTTEDVQGGGTLNVLTSAGLEAPSGPQSPLPIQGLAGSRQNSGAMGTAKSGTLLVQRTLGPARSSHTGTEVLSAAEMPTLDGQPIVTEAAGPADAVCQSSVGPSTLDAACELGKPVDVLPEAALYEVQEQEEECGVCMESMATFRLLPCTHTICGPCAQRMCSMFIQRAPHCPFCRSIIADVTAFYVPLLAPKAAALIPA